MKFAFTEYRISHCSGHAVDAFTDRKGWGPRNLLTLVPILPTVNVLKVLGVHYDTQMSMSQHVDSLVSACKRRAVLLRRLHTASWGPSLQVMRSVCTTWIQSVATFAIGSWYPQLSTASKAKLLRLDHHLASEVLGISRSASTVPCLIESGLKPLEVVAQREVIRLGLQSDSDPRCGALAGRVHSDVQLAGRG
eukprot:4863381-Amphidinium_carterae.1